MRYRLTLMLALVVAGSALGCVAAAAPASASAFDVLSDCAYDGRLSKVYPRQDYESALRQIPAVDDEYTGCSEVIRRAMNAVVAHGAGTGSAGPADGTSNAPGAAAAVAAAAADEAVVQRDADPLASATPAERASFAQATAQAAPKLLGNPAAAHILVHATPRRLPSTLVALLVAGGVLAVAAAVRRVRRGATAG
jgi:hypothetical protein